MTIARSFFRHLPFSLRLIRRSPLSSATVVIAMALAIAASTTVASIAYSALLQSLPFDQPSQLVALSSEIAPIGKGPETNYQDALTIRDQATTLSTLAVYGADNVGLRAHAADTPQPGIAISATVELQDVLRVRPVVGRLFLPDDFRAGTSAALIAHRFWRTHYAGDPDVIGRPMFIGSRQLRIVGVLPEEAGHFPTGGADVWVPLVFPSTSFLNLRGSMALLAVARLRDGVVVSDLNRELGVISSRLAAEFPATNAKRRVVAAPLRDAMSGPVRPMLLLLASGIGVVLLVACANIGNLLLAQSHGRRREFAVRRALGASRGDVVCQLAAETTAVCGLAGIIGIGLAPLLTRLVLGLYPEALPLAGAVSLNGPVLGMAVSVTLVAALVAGLPRLRSVNRDGFDDSGISSGRATHGGLSPRMSTVLTAVQVLFSVVLISVGGLLVRTFVSISDVSPGFDPSGLVTIQVSIPPQPSPAAMANRQDAIRDVAATMPGVTSAAHAMFIPFTLGSWGDAYQPLGVADMAASRPLAHFYMVSPTYLKTVGIPLLAGRGLTADDNDTAPRVVVISRQFSRIAFGEESAVGRRLSWNGAEWQVVGVAGDIRHAAPWAPPDGDVYVPRQQVVRGNTWILMRTSGAQPEIARELQARLNQAGLPATIVGAASMRDRINAVAALSRFRAVLAAILAVIALGLAALGIYSLTAFSVTQHVRDIGLRMALGATPGSVIQREIATAWKAVAIGLIPGLGVSLLLRSWLGRWLDGLSSSPVLTILGAVILFAALATVAAWLPARRASRIDPLDALRSE